MASLVTRKAVGRSAIWSLLDGTVNQAISIGVFFVVARFVTPAEFGIMVGALLTIELVRVGLLDSISTSLLAKPELREVDYSSCFVLMTVVALIACVAINLPLQFVRPFKGMPLLTEILPFVSVLLVINGLSKTHEVWLSRHLHFGSLAARSMISNAAGGAVGVILAVRGYGVWALVWQQMTASVTSALLLWFLAPWRPQLRCDRSSVGELFGTARHVMFMNFTNFFYSQADSLLTATFLGPTAMGLYNAGKRIGNSVSNVISMPLGRVATPTFANVQGDRARLGRAYLQALALTATLTTPAFAGIAVLSGELVTILLGDTWLSAGAVLACLAPSFFLVTVGQYNFSILITSGKAKLLSYITIVGAVVSLVVFLIAVPYGIVVLAAAMSFRTLMLFPLSAHAALRCLGLRWRDYFGVMAAPLLGSLAMVIYLLMMRTLFLQFDLLLRTIALILSAIVVYLAAMMIIKPSYIKIVYETARGSFARSNARHHIKDNT